MNLTTTSVSLGGLVVGLGILVFVAVRWWTKSRFRWARLLPFTLSTIYGSLLILTAGGVLGILAGVTLWGSNHAGDAGLEYGVGGGTPDATGTSPVFLTDGGHAAVLLITVGLITYVWFSKRLRRLDVALGLVCGICLGLSASWAGWIASWAGVFVNWAGFYLTGGH